MITSLYPNLMVANKSLFLTGKGYRWQEMGPIKLAEKGVLSLSSYNQYKQWSRHYWRICHIVLKHRESDFFESNMRKKKKKHTKANDNATVRQNCNGCSLMLLVGFGLLKGTMKPERFHVDGPQKLWICLKISYDYKNTL